MSSWNQVSWAASRASRPHYGTFSKLLKGHEELPQVYPPKFQAKILGCIYLTDDKKILSLNNRYSEHPSAGQGLLTMAELAAWHYFNTIKMEGKCRPETSVFQTVESNSLMDHKINLLDPQKYFKN